MTLAAPGCQQGLATRSKPDTPTDRRQRGFAWTNVDYSWGPFTSSEVPAEMLGDRFARDEQAVEGRRDLLMAHRSWSPEVKMAYEFGRLGSAFPSGLSAGTAIRASDRGASRRRGTDGQTRSPSGSDRVERVAGGAWIRAVGGGTNLISSMG